MRFNRDCFQNYDDRPLEQTIIYFLRPHGLDCCYCFQTAIVRRSITWRHLVDRRWLRLYLRGSVLYQQTVVIPPRHLALFCIGRKRLSFLRNSFICVTDDLIVFNQNFKDLNIKKGMPTI